MRITDEPLYEPLDMSISKWKKIEPTLIQLDNLVLSRDYISITGLIAVMKNRKPHSNDRHLHVVKYNGELWLVEGYHRFILAYIRGFKEVYARVYIKESD